VLLLDIKIEHSRSLSIIHSFSNVYMYDTDLVLVTAFIVDSYIVVYLMLNLILICYYYRFHLMVLVWDDYVA
jgi:hypothetical protein